MNGTAARTTVRNLLIAAPLALGALTLTAAPALAAPVGPAGPGFVQPEGDDPPQPPAPNPAIPPGPGDVTDVPDCNNPDDPCFPGPDDEDDEPELNPAIPPGPDGITSKPPCPTHGDCGGGGGGGDGGGTDEGGELGTGDIPVPTRIDTGADGDEGLELSWVLAGGAVLTATAVAPLLARRPVRSRR